MMYITVCDLVRFKVRRPVYVRFIEEYLCRNCAIFGAADFPLLHFFILYNRKNIFQNSSEKLL